MSDEQPATADLSAKAKPRLTLTTGDPRFDPRERLTVNGFPFAPAGANDYEAAWREFSDRLEWMQGCKARPVRYLGWHMADIANDLIQRAYPDLAESIPKP